MLILFDVEVDIHTLSVLLMLMTSMGHLCSNIIPTSYPTLNKKIVGSVAVTKIIKNYNVIEDTKRGIN